VLATVKDEPLRGGAALHPWPPLRAAHDALPWERRRRVVSGLVARRGRGEITHTTSRRGINLGPALLQVGVAQQVGEHPSNAVCRRILLLLTTETGKTRKCSALQQFCRLSEELWPCRRGIQHASSW